VLDVEPPPASLQVMRDEPDAGAAELAQRRSTTPAALRRTLSGDLDNILKKGLQKEPASRYASVLTLAEDIKRHLQHLPVSVRGESLVYRTAKFVRRYRAGVAACLAVALAVAAGAAGIAWQARIARAESHRAEKVTEFLIDVFQQADPEHSQDNAVTVKKVLELGARQIDRELKDEPLVQADLDDALARINGSLGNHDLALDRAQRELQLRRQTLPADDFLVGQSLRTLGRIYLEREELTPAQEALNQAAAIIASRRGKDSVDMIDVYGDLSQIESSLDHREQSVALGRRAYEIARTRLGATSPVTAEKLLDLGEQLENAGEYDEAERSDRGAIAAYTANFGPDDSRVAQSRMQLGGLLDRVSRGTEAAVEMNGAIEILRKVYGNHDPRLAEALFSRGILLSGERQYDRAYADLRETLDIYPPDSHDAAQSHRYIGTALMSQERYAEAVAELQIAYNGFRSAKLQDQAQTDRTLADLAAARMRGGDPAGAEPMLREAIATLERRLGPDSYDIRNPLKRLGEDLTDLGRYQESLDVLHRVRTLELKLFGSDSVQDFASTDYLIARVLVSMNTPASLAEARPYAEHSVALEGKYFPGTTYGLALLVHGRLNLATGNRDGARNDFAAALNEFQRANSNESHILETRELLEKVGQK
jgi:serine/threonine-protein kinase